jgi:hypothetical protein
MRLFLWEMQELSMSEAHLIGNVHSFWQDYAVRQIFGSVIDGMFPANASNQAPMLLNIYPYLATRN